MLPTVTQEPGEILQSSHFYLHVQANQWRVVRARGVEAIVGAMRALREHAMVQLSALLAFIPLALENAMLQVRGGLASTPLVQYARALRARHVQLAVRAAGLHPAGARERDAAGARGLVWLFRENVPSGSVRDRLSLGKVSATRTNRFFQHTAWWIPGLCLGVSTLGTRAAGCWVQAHGACLALFMQCFAICTSEGAWRRRMWRAWRWRRCCTRWRGTTTWPMCRPRGLSCSAS